MGKRRLTVVAMLMALLWTGCATTAQMVETKDEGTSQVYHIGTRQAWKIAKTVLQWEGTDAFEDQRSKGYMVARNGAKWVPWTSMTVVWVNRVDRKHTQVIVMTKRRIGTKSWSSEHGIHKNFAKAVKMVKAGRSLPSALPPN